MTDIEIYIPYRIGFGRFSFYWTKKIKRKFATSINELTAKQLLTYCNTVGEKHVNEGILKVKLLSRLYKLPLLLLYTMTRVQLAHLTLYLQPLLNQVRLTADLLPVLRVKTFWRSTTLFSCGDYFRHLHMGEFIAAHAYFKAYQETGQQSCLDLMVAVLYRETDHKDPFGDKREAFNADKISHRARLTASLPAAVKMAILYYFAGCMAQVTEDYEAVFSADSEQEAGGDWVDLIRSLPNEKFGTLEEIENLNVHVVFDLMNRMIQDQQKFKQRNHES